MPYPFDGGSSIFGRFLYPIEKAEHDVQPGMKIHDGLNGKSSNGVGCIHVGCGSWIN